MLSTHRRSSSAPEVLLKNPEIASQRCWSVGRQTGSVEPFSPTDVQSSLSVNRAPNLGCEQFPSSPLEINKVIGCLCTDNSIESQLILCLSAGQVRSFNKAGQRCVQEEIY